jgi:hypothetical protein
MFLEFIRGHNKKKRRPWPLSDISFMILKHRGDANREGNSITNVYVIRGP